MGNASAVECWSVREDSELEVVPPDADLLERCAQRYASLEAAQAACLLLRGCRGVTRDNGIVCGRPDHHNEDTAERSRHPQPLPLA